MYCISAAFSQLEHILLAWCCLPGANMPDRDLPLAALLCAGPAITHFQQIFQVRAGFWELLILAIGLAESYRVAVGWATPTGNGFNSLKEDYEMGNLGFDPLGLAPTDPEELKQLQTKELNNGRLAMVAIAAFVAQELVEQTEIFEHLFLRFEKEAILELDDIERDLNLPVTPLPAGLEKI